MTLKRASVNLARILVLALCVLPCAWPQSSTDKKPDHDTKSAAEQPAKPGVKPGPAAATKPSAPPAPAGKPAPAPAAKPGVKPGPAAAAKPPAPPAPAGKPAPAPAAKPGAKPGPAAAAKPPAAPKSTVKAASKPARKGKVAEKQSAGVNPPSGTPKPEGTGPQEKPEAESANKRDPFIPLISQEKAAGGGNLPPGKAGLVVGTVRVDGTVRSQGAMIAVVTNPEQRVYFIRQGDHLYDGDVEKIDMDGVTFRVSSKDAFGRPIERVITKRIYAKAGEQQ